MRIFIITLAVVFLSAFSCTTINNTNTGNSSVLTGRIEIYGNEPFTYVGIVDSSGVAYNIIPRSTADELRSLQGHLIEFTVSYPEEQIQGYGSLPGGTVTPISWKIIR